MRFWDTSAIVPLLVADAATSAVEATYRQDPAMTVWWATEVECVSAVTRLERDGALSEASVSASLVSLRALASAWTSVDPLDRLREVAIRVLQTHALRAADALQIAAAISAAEDRPATLSLVTLDARLAQAATREGFIVVVPGA